MQDVLLVLGKDFAATLARPNNLATMLANLGGWRQQIYADCAAIYEN